MKLFFMQPKQPTHPLLRSKGVKPRRGAVLSCRHCGIEFYVSPSRLKPVNSGNGRTALRQFCSRKCASYAQLTNTPLLCVICGSKFYASKSQVKYRNRKTCSRQCNKSMVRQIAIQRRIDNGYTQHQLDRLARYAPEAEIWRKAVFERDDYTCQFCVVRGGKLEADHVLPFAYFPEIRYELSNGRTLCRNCHSTTKMSASKMRKIYGQSSAGTQRTQTR